MLLRALILLATLVEPVFLRQVSNSSILVKEDQTQILNCGEDNSTLESYQWYKDGNIIEDAVQSNLTLIDLQFEDSGIYICKNLKDVRTYANLTVGRVPYNLSVPECISHDALHIDCFWEEGGDTNLPTEYDVQYSSDSKTWYSCPRVVDQNHCSLGRIPFDEDKHYLRLHASNDLGSGTSVLGITYLEHITIPYPPGNITLNASTSRSMEIQFERDHGWNGFYIQMAYKYRYKLSGETGPDLWMSSQMDSAATGGPPGQIINKQQTKHMTATLHSFVIKVKHPYTQVCVQIALAIGHISDDSHDQWSDWSDIMCKHTLQEQPSEAPGNFIFKFRQNLAYPQFRTGNFTWEPIRKEFRNGIIRFYNLTLKTSTDGDEINTTSYRIGPNQTNYTINELWSYRPYYATLVAVNDIGRSPSANDSIHPIQPPKRRMPLIIVILMVVALILCMLAFCILGKKWFSSKKIPDPQFLPPSRLAVLNQTKLWVPEKEIFDTLIKNEPETAWLQEGTLLVTIPDNEVPLLHPVMEEVVRGHDGGVTFDEKITEGRYKKVTKRERHVSVSDSGISVESWRRSSSWSDSGLVNQSNTEAPSSDISDSTGHDFRALSASKDARRPSNLYGPFPPDQISYYSLQANRLSSVEVSDFEGDVRNAEEGVTDLSDPEERMDHPQSKNSPTTKELPYIPKDFVKAFCDDREGNETNSNSLHSTGEGTHKMASSNGLTVSITNEEPTPQDYTLMHSTTSETIPALLPDDTYDPQFASHLPSNSVWENNGTPSSKDGITCDSEGSVEYCAMNSTTVKLAVQTALEFPSGHLYENAPEPESCHGNCNSLHEPASII